MASGAICGIEEGAKTQDMAVEDKEGNNVSGKSGGCLVIQEGNIDGLIKR